MILFAVSHFAGMLPIVRPCILPVLPFVFARADQPFLRSGLPMLVGMAFTFAGVATLAAVGGSWAVEANEYGRLAAITLLAVFGLTLLVPELAEWMTRPLVAAGARLSQSIGQGEPQRDTAVLPSFLLGIATGLLWAPCAGPILGLVLTGAALEGASAGTSLLLLAHAPGAPPPPPPGPLGCGRRPLPAAARLCGRRRDLAGAGAAGGRPRLRRHEEVARRRRVDPARPRRGGPRWRRSDRARARYRIPDADFGHDHRRARAAAAGPD